MKAFWKVGGGGPGGQSKGTESEEEGSEENFTFAVAAISSLDTVLPFSRCYVWLTSSVSVAEQHLTG